jgi:hypothetical protein
MYLVRQYEVLKLSEDTLVLTRMMIQVFGDLNIWREREREREMIIVYNT